MNFWWHESSYIEQKEKPAPNKTLKEQEEVNSTYFWGFAEAFDSRLLNWKNEQREKTKLEITFCSGFSDTYRFS